MFRRVIVTTGAVLAAASLVAVVGISAATASTTKPVKFTGKLTCTLTGSVAAKPGLTDAGGKATTLTLSGKLSKCTGSTKKSGVKITGGKVLATSKLASNGCAALLATLPPLKGSITYATKGGKAVASKFNFSTGKVASASPITVDYPAKGGTVKVTGSFAGSKGLATLVVKQAETALLGECGTAAGVTVLTLTSKSKMVVG